MYKMELKTNEKIFLITIGGFMTEEESISFIAEMKKNIKNINPTQYNIVVDSRELKTSSPQLVGLMEEAMTLLTTTPFKTRYSIMPKNIIATSQVKRVSKENNKFNDTIFVESYEEILNQLFDRAC